MDRYVGKIVLHEGDPRAAANTAEGVATARELRLVAIAAERKKLYRLHTQDAINDEALRIIEEELDERELLFSADALRG